jgi:dynein heavy chain
MPVYKTIDRKGEIDSMGNSTYFIIYIDCPTNENADFWILKSTAFICEIEKV